MELNRYLLINKNLYMIISTNNFESENLFLDALALSFKKGVKIVQIETDGIPTKQILKISKKVRELCSFFEVLFIISSRIDIAILAEADGIMLDNDDIDIENAKKLVSQNFLIGVKLKDRNSVISEKTADFILFANTDEQERFNTVVPVFYLTDKVENIHSNKYKTAFIHTS